MITRGRAASVLVVAWLAGCRRGDAEVRTVSAPSDAGARTAVVDSGASLDASVDAPVDAPAAQEGYTVAALVVDERGAYWFANVHDLLTQRPSGEGSPVTLAKAVHQPIAIALDANRVYWVDDEELVAVARADGTKRTVAKLARPRGLVLDGRTALVIADDGESTSAVFRVPLEGGAPKKLAAVPAAATALAADESSIFVVTDAVLRIPKSGGPAKKVSASPEEAQAIVLVRDDILFIGSDPQAMTGRVWKMPKRGPAPQPRRAHDDTSLTMVMYAGAVPVSGEGGSVTALATDGRRPFWIKGTDDPDVTTASLETPGPKDEPTELAKVPSASGLAVFRSQLYWSTPSGVKSMPLPR